MGAWLGCFQAWLFFPMLLLEGLHLHIAGMRALVGHSGKARWAEAGLLAVHTGSYLTAVFAVLSPLPAVVFLVVQQGPFGAHVGASFAPNHKGMPVVGKDEKVDFLRRQVLTSRNIRGSLLTDLALAGLTTRLSTTCSRPCRGRICVTPRRRCGRFAPSAAFLTRTRACWPPMRRYCGTAARLAGQPARNRLLTEPPQVRVPP